jgi:hypothetical protein
VECKRLRLTATAGEELYLYIFSSTQDDRTLSRVGQPV